MLHTVKGLVLRETAAGDNLRYINVLTENFGRLSVMVRGSVRLRNRFTAATRIFSYSEFVLYEHDGRYTLNEASLIENYFDICEDFDRMTIGTYVLNTAEYVTNENQPDPEILRLALNTLWALTHLKDKDMRLIKAVYEMRLALLLGFAPNVVHCKVCGHGVCEDRLYLNVTEGSMTCATCKNTAYDVTFMESDSVADPQSAQFIIPLSPASVLAIQHSLYADKGKLFSFTLAPEVLPEFAGFCEKYLECHTEHHFSVLDMLTF